VFAPGAQSRWKEPGVVWTHEIGLLRVAFEAQGDE
jgi:hypothetical protein